MKRDECADQILLEYVVLHRCVTGSVLILQENADIGIANIDDNYIRLAVAIHINHSY